MASSTRMPNFIWSEEFAIWFTELEGLSGRGAGLVPPAPSAFGSHRSRAGVSAPGTARAVPLRDGDPRGQQGMLAPKVQILGVGSCKRGKV